MNNQTFLELSLLVRKLPLENISDLWAYRYSFFVQNSPRGHNCTYSRMCRERFLESEIKQLGNILDGCVAGPIETVNLAKKKLEALNDSES